MDYQLHYANLINRAKNRSLDVYVERHHIIPKCMGGSNKKENIVRLTAEEHFVAHQLLVKIYPNNQYLVLAVKMMTVSGGNVIRNNKMFGWLRKKFSEVMKEQVVSNETRLKFSEIAKNREFTDETRKKMSDSGKKRKSKYKGLKIHNDISKSKISEAGKRPCKLETKIKIGDANRGRPSKFKGISLPKMICPHCNKEGGGGSMKRYHFEKCKELNDHRS